MFICLLYNLTIGINRYKISDPQVDQILTLISTVEVEEDDCPSYIS